MVEKKETNSTRGGTGQIANAYVVGSVASGLGLLKASSFLARVARAVGREAARAAVAVRQSGSRAVAAAQNVASSHNVGLERDAASPG